ncbi:TPA: tetratricopeptide repeat protein [Streptococcus pneumoniae]|uniref:TPR domain protein n=2 Tax=Streptococcus pneumoniae TaxID=1313 RepID=A0A0E8P9B6_STREE|nr:tetratricopeptide repeat protein [Streptococcus pneumoniae]EGJ14136.1 tetratricopeptide repeat family protein [Streptococcus pneumoniae GA47368]EHD29053.1 tetratricopeptide repeat family protein [Streptococcus pneumoniae GA11184]EHD32501.1 tetratricopeptide repeat family protein [Streptococcus pneumoniae 6735-05]EHD41974.1 tetratricopeptide repeat family protein [Streptococcus pneumoniae GA43265]EHD49839.1 tetratricopeptide repeat family protein [Streptococcus pneumoniae 6901-05]EHD58669.1
MNNSQQMLQALEEQDLTKAEHYFAKALENDSSNLLYELATYLEGIGFYPQAKEIYLKIVEDFPEVHLNLAAIASEDGQIEEAFTYLEEIQADSDWYVSSLVLKADLYQLEGLTDVAREKLLEALTYSEDSLLILGLAELDSELENYQAAIQAYAQLDNRSIYEQTGISTYQRIGFAYAQLGKFETATEFLEKALELEYDDLTAFELASLYFDQEEYQKATLYFKQLDTISPDFEGYEYGYSQALHKEHQVQEALRIAKQGLEKNPFETRLLLAASQFSYELHDASGAENYLLTAKEDAEDTEEILLRLATIYLEQERYEDILDLQSEEPENLLTKWMIARSYQEMDDLDTAYEHYQELTGDLKDNPEFLEHYIYLLRELGHFEEAKVHAHTYLKLVPDDVQMQELFERL